MSQIQHFLDIKHTDINFLNKILEISEQIITLPKKVSYNLNLLTEHKVANLFFEPSTRTRTSFEIAAKNLGAQIINLDINSSATKKGETLLDTIYTLEAMGCDIFVIRHSENEISHFVAQHVLPNTHIINAGDGTHEHPTQAMLDMLTIKQVKGSFNNLKVAIVGDIKHSRVARSQIFALTALGVPEIRLIAPKNLLPQEINNMGIKAYHELVTGIKDVDVVITLRLQKERMQETLIPSQEEYFKQFGITLKSLENAKKDVIILHPGPMNRGVEIESAVADSSRSQILNQVKNGVILRMAVMSLITNKHTMLGTKI